MVEVVGIDHLVVRVSDFQRSRTFYGRLFPFLGFVVLDEYEDMMGWTNTRTRYWIAQADAEGRKHPYRTGDVGFHHYAFQLLLPVTQTRAQMVNSAQAHQRSAHAIHRQ